MRHMKKRLLILSCSERKNDSPGLLPAILRYDGPTFRVVRKFLRENPKKSQAIDVSVISAEFGFISADLPISTYDRRMNLKRANELRPETIRKIKQTVQAEEHKELFVNLGKDYLAAILGLSELIPAKIVFAQGS